MGSNCCNAWLRCNVFSSCTRLLIISVIVIAAADIGGLVARGSVRFFRTLIVVAALRLLLGADSSFGQSWLFCSVIRRLLSGNVTVLQEAAALHYLQLFQMEVYLIAR